MIGYTKSRNLIWLLVRLNVHKNTFVIYYLRLILHVNIDETFMLLQKPKTIKKDNVKLTTKSYFITYSSQYMLTCIIFCVSKYVYYYICRMQLYAIIPKWIVLSYGFIIYYLWLTLYVNILKSYMTSINIPKCHISDFQNT